MLFFGGWRKISLIFKNRKFEKGFNTKKNIIFFKLGLVLALSVEESNLHKRIAYKVN